MTYRAHCAGRRARKARDRLDWFNGRGKYRPRGVIYDDSPGPGHFVITSIDTMAGVLTLAPDPDAIHIEPAFDLTRAIQETAILGSSSVRVSREHLAAMYPEHVKPKLWDQPPSDIRQDITEAMQRIEEQDAWARETPPIRFMSPSLLAECKRLGLIKGDS